MWRNWVSLSVWEMISVWAKMVSWNVMSCKRFPHCRPFAKGIHWWFPSQSVSDAYPCRQQNLWGQHGAHLGPAGPRWGPYWPHEPCYQSSFVVFLVAVLNKLLNKHSNYRWFGTLWCSCDALAMVHISMLYKNHMYQGMDKIFCVEFQRVPLKFHTKYLAHTLKDMDFIHRWKCKSS